MKAVCLWQPWASAVALGHKVIETRGWPTTHRGPIAIHAAKRWQGDQREDAAYFARRFEIDWPCPTPLGVIVCVAQLVECRVMDEAWVRAQTPLERELGGWVAGRYGWILEDVRPLKTPVKVRGYQQLWDLGEETAALVRREAGL